MVSLAFSINEICFKSFNVLYFAWGKFQGHANNGIAQLSDFENSGSLFGAEKMVNDSIKQLIAAKRCNTVYESSFAKNPTA